MAGARVSVLVEQVVIGAAAALCVALIAAALMVFVWSTKPVYRIAVRDFKVEGLDSAFGESLAGRVIAAVGDRDLPVVSRVRSSRGDYDGARFIVGGDIQRIGDRIKVDIQLDDAASGLTLWTDSISRSSSEADALQDQVAGKVADVMSLTRKWLGPHGDSAKPEILAALFKATDSLRDLDSTVLQTREAFRRFRDLAPESSGAHSAYAMATALASGDQTPEAAAQWQAEAASEARRAIALDPTNGEGYLTLGVLTPDNDLATREAWFVKGLRADPHNSSLPNFLGELLMQVGRVDDGLILIDRSVKLDPLSPPKTQSLINAMAIAGRFDDANMLIERSYRLWPDNIHLRRAILFRSLIYATPARAWEALDRFQAADKPLSVDRALLWRDFEKVREGAAPPSSVENRLAPPRSHSDKDLSAAKAAMASLHNDEFSAVVAALASLGDQDGAIRTIDLARSVLDDPETTVLFEPAAQSLRNDARFPRVAAELGLVRYWTQSKRKPDFCAVRPPAVVCS